MADFFGFKITTSKKQKVLFDYANTTPVYIYIHTHMHIQSHTQFPTIVTVCDCWISISASGLLVLPFYGSKPTNQHSGLPWEYNWAADL